MFYWDFLNTFVNIVVFIILLQYFQMHFQRNRSTEIAIYTLMHHRLQNNKFCNCFLPIVEHLLLQSPVHYIILMQNMANF